MKSDRIVITALALIVAGAIVGLAAPAGHGQTQPLPPGHPPAEGRQPIVPAPPPGSGSGGQGLTWTVPPGWTKEKPASSMRRAQYRMPGPGGAAECVVFYFGPGQGGDTPSNVARWAGQFKNADGTPVTGDALKTRDIKVGDIAVALVEVRGTYVGGMGANMTGPDRPDYILLGAIADGPDTKWFFRATGPRTTLESQRAAFDRMVRSITRGPNA